MKKILSTAAALIGASASVCAHNGDAEKDSLKVINLQEVQVVSTRATGKTPVAFTNIGKTEIVQRNFGKDIPFLLSSTPSVLVTSDAGAGIGYTGIRIRGTDATRINITVNGIPLNDAESHSVFWVNMPDFASSVKDIQVQRGAGTSTNGAGAFGASINMQTNEISYEPYAEISGSFGSFRTHKETVKVGTGLLNHHWTFDARLSNIGTDGYIDRASARLGSYYLQGGYYDSDTSVKLILFGGKERTYHAWNYASKKAMTLFGRRFNPCGYMYVEDKAGIIHQPDIDYDDYMDEADKLLKEGGRMHFYDDQTDNYIQTNGQLLFSRRINAAWNLNAGLHYTKGDGYYQEYKRGRKLKEYGLPTFNVDGTEVKKTDLVRKKAMDNGFGGGIFSIDYNDGRLNASLGGGLNRYDGDHFGRVLWLQNYIGTNFPEKEYYRNNAAKNDGNLYLKGTFDTGNGVSLYADLQYRHITYKIDGNNENWNDLTNAMQKLNVNEKFDFFNPKAGVFWQINPNNRLYGSFSVAHKEPTRNNYTDGKLNATPKAERLFDYELGYTYANSCFTAGINLYYMDYKDQLVLTGELNEIGEAMAANVPESYRMGAEFMAGLHLPCGFRWDVNATLSRNRIKHFTEQLYFWGESDPVAIEHRNTRIAFSPDLMLNNRFGYRYKGFEASLQSKYVGKQYMSNMELEAHSLDAYFVNDLHLSYTFSRPRLKTVTLGCSIYNLLNEEYESNGYAGSLYTDATTKARENYAGYAAQAGTHILGHITLRF